MINSIIKYFNELERKNNPKAERRMDYPFGREFTFYNRTFRYIFTDVTPNGAEDVFFEENTKKLIFLPKNLLETHEINF